MSGGSQIDTCLTTARTARRPSRSQKPTRMEAMQCSRRETCLVCRRADEDRTSGPVWGRTAGASGGAAAARSTSRART
eukprot:1156119-Rhodomonas_salina.1